MNLLQQELTCKPTKDRSFSNSLKKVLTPDFLIATEIFIKKFPELFKKPKNIVLYKNKLSFSNVRIIQKTTEDSTTFYLYKDGAILEKISLSSHLDTTKEILKEAFDI